MRQAVIVIHGIGEQKPMDTLRSFTKNITKGKLRNRPDYMSTLFELRCLQIPSARNQPITDLYEYYWAHHMRDTKIRSLLSWVRTLLFRKPINVSQKLRPYYYMSWILILIALQFFYPFIKNIISGNYKESLTSITLVLGLLFLDYNILRIAYGAIDDAARYLNPQPDNIEQRNKIRQEGIELLKTLHKTKRYSRIVIVGHSLGSVIAYDLIRLYWATIKMSYESSKKRQVLLKQFSSDCDRVFNDGKSTLNEKTVNYQQIQLELWKELREFNWPWLITDFITVGSPLAHADMLLARSREEFNERKTEGEFPTNPPLAEHEIYYKINFKTSLGPRSLFSPTHLTPFLCTRWTNIFFPHKYLIVGDLVGGPVRNLFGAGIRDIPVGLTGLSNLLLSHTRYWKYNEKEKNAKSIKHPSEALKNSLKLDCERGKMTWPEP